MTFQKEEFKTITPNTVLVYVCGPTVYDSPHLGHAKSAVAFDMIRRFLKFKGYDVTFVKNYTDIDDKIIKRANERGMDFRELSEHYIKEYEEIMQILNIEKDTINPRATDVIDYMIEIIKALIEKDNAYESNGSVYFSVKTFPKYISLFWNVSEEELASLQEDSEPSEQNDGNQYGLGYGASKTSELLEKRDPKDFALWKKSKEDEPFWESPWGKGRPGWHIECSAMVLKYLGETIDIHGGGQDLKSPHHRNEIAQSEAYTGKTFANYYMHNGFVNVNNEKMSKSLGNFFIVSDVAKNYDPMVIRWFLLSSHYRKSINYSLDTMTQAQKNYERVIKSIKMVNDINPGDDGGLGLIEMINNSREKIITLMEDDFDTPVALAELLVLIRGVNKAILEEKTPITNRVKTAFFEYITFIDQIFGLFPNLEETLLGLSSENMDNKDEKIKDLLDLIIEVRSKLRKKKLYDISDEIREKLRSIGFEIEDN